MTEEFVDLAVPSAGDVFAVVLSNGNVGLFTEDGLQRGLELKTNERIRSVAVSPDGESIWTYGEKLCRWSSTGEVQDSIDDGTHHRLLTP